MSDPTGSRLGFFERRRIDRMARRLALRDEPGPHLGEAKLLLERQTFFHERDVALAALRAQLLPQRTQHQSMATAYLQQVGSDPAVPTPATPGPVSTAGLDPAGVRAARRNARVEAQKNQAALAAAQQRATLQARADEANSAIAALEKTYEARVELEHRLAMLRRKHFDSALRRYHSHPASLNLDDEEPEVPAALQSLSAGNATSAATAVVEKP